MISAIIVTYNPNICLLQDQLKRVLSEVDCAIYVDNNSSNISEIRSAINIVASSKILLIENKENKGLGEAQNQGIIKAQQFKTDYVVIFDQDSLIKPGFISALQKGYESLLDKGINVGAVGPVYINENTQERYPITKYWGPFIKRLYPSNLPVEASVLISSGTLIAEKTINRTGLMEERFFIDYIDIEWSYRAQREGFKLFVIPEATMIHQIGDGRMSIFGRMVSVHSPIRRYYLSRNSIHMVRCPYVSWGYKLRELVFNVLRIFIFAIVSKDRAKYLKFSFLGLLDGIKGKFGPMPIRKI